MHSKYTNELGTGFALHFLELVHKINPKIPEKNYNNKMFILSNKFTPAPKISHELYL